ncbi:TetR/AcrR family transcriptional regulator [Ligilactobacillus acidipiscis]|uniref:TetR/AcrR family transcriptional regulator n=1 Tax=Ligilactobacillus acidipiscis TaxID=89059 RepID=UPI0023F8BF83|nr:TetR/AcrR family transcriptional regulator [Ligilactobacillus acidipiscis]WEV56774.1 TetR/AcrR family transcriptional regulator [Ligilactobacillus acidipiscis]
MNFSATQALNKWYETQNMPSSQIKVLDAAITLFSENGYDKTSTNEIAKKAGVSQAVLFKYFHSKHKLLEKILEPLFKNIVPRFTVQLLDEILKEHQDQGLFAILSFVTRDRFKFMVDNNELVNILINVLLTDDTVKEQIKKMLVHSNFPVIIRIQKFFKRFPEIKGNADLDNLFYLFVTQLIGYFILRFRLLPKNTYNTEQDLARITSNIYNALQAEQPRR